MLFFESFPPKCVLAKLAFQKANSSHCLFFESISVFSQDGTTLNQSCGRFVEAAILRKNRNPGERIAVFPGCSSYLIIIDLSMATYFEYWRNHGLVGGVASEKLSTPTNTFLGVPD